MQVDFDPTVPDSDAKTWDGEPIRIFRTEPGADIKLPPVSTTRDDGPVEDALTQRIIRMRATVFHGVDALADLKQADFNSIEFDAKAASLWKFGEFRNSLISQMNPVAISRDGFGSIEGKVFSFFCEGDERVSLHVLYSPPTLCRSSLSFSTPAWARFAAPTIPDSFPPRAFSTGVVQKHLA